MSLTPPRLCLFVFFAVAPPTPVTARSVNPDFLFGFDKEYSLNYTEPLKNPDDTDTVVSPPGNVSPLDAVPVQIQEILAQVSYNSTMQIQPVVYGFIPLMSSVTQEQANIPMGGSPLSYDVVELP
ncbi:hypothetical protein L2E82_06925 [Cichorium intybus]|uniref:Uncharacterized protein n=1 Tax=Cichorium intybus TaxID=13427 RepID=A0ACB9G381_CICIN|nr:hypothetical protein L2E82_06925 [Cichorium intybus]